ncbi:hypothetical protein pdam_00005658 [Pocillopora damicornis]|uniref:Nucleolar protein Dnt1-like N-terminal domain-containing protein n=1 Tax=Pocillopora damicornis TaxID=46731 RepID=A0A3M6V5L4_POCDA|nr:uncharacterized protein LOC113684663 [Pocillopora damicornis]RMX61170.1 hypothetical protein pdam_00005658 [Pocillopora damicornis]
MAEKLRINVVCSSRDKRFLVLAEKEWTLAAFKRHTEDVFHKLYPNEPKLKISGLQNEFHFDMPLIYKVDETLVDAGLVFILEEEVNLMASLSHTSSTETNSLECKFKVLGDTRKHDETAQQKSPQKRLKAVKKTSKRKKIHTSTRNKFEESSPNNRVTSTTSPIAVELASLLPQIVEKISEDSEVDIESVEDSTAQLQGKPDNTLRKEAATTKKKSQLLLRKARKIKSKSAVKDNGTLQNPET